MLAKPDESQIYVAELRVPAYFQVTQKASKPLPNPDAFKVYKGYWTALAVDEQSTEVGYPAELALIITFEDKTLKHAEEHALNVGRRFGSTTSAFGGYPLEPERLYRIAVVDGVENLLSQHNYYYEGRLRKALAKQFDQITQHEYQKYLEYISLADDRLQSAIHWYRIAASVDTPTVSYVAAWMGLESIGKTMSDIFHQEGSKVACPTCRNKAGEKRDRTIAGIDHVFNFGTPGSAENFSSKRARCLRNDVVHNKRPYELLLQECSEFRQFLIDALNSSILTAMSCLGHDANALKLFADDYEFRPRGRLSIKFKEGLKNISPYYGLWIEGDRDREYQKGAHGVEASDWVSLSVTELKLDKPASHLVEAVSYIEFERYGEENLYALPDGAAEKPTIIPWHGRPSSPAWEPFSTSEWEVITEPIHG